MRREIAKIIVQLSDESQWERWGAYLIHRTAFYRVLLHNNRVSLQIEPVKRLFPKWFKNCGPWTTVELQADEVVPLQHAYTRMHAVLVAKARAERLAEQTEDLKQRLRMPETDYAAIRGKVEE